MNSKIERFAWEEHKTKIIDNICKKNQWFWMLNDEDDNYSKNVDVDVESNKFLLL